MGIVYLIFNPHLTIILCFATLWPGRAGEILDFDSVYTSCIAIVSLSILLILDCPNGISYTSQFIILSAKILDPNLTFWALANKVFNLPLVISSSTSPIRPSSITVLPVGTM